MLRWKKNKRPSGLAAIGSGPLGSVLHDGVKEYARVSAHSPRHSGKTGWYWTCPTDAVGQYMNTCNEPVEDEASAKYQAMAFVKSKIKSME